MQLRSFLEIHSAGTIKGKFEKFLRAETEEVLAALHAIERHAIPLLFANLEKDSTTGLWQETDRLFVVPDTWP